ncbi:short-chain dehydrogenase [Mycobacterium tuberculosis]|nr:short-chain dehydrogenase [Mycobacterium tuberculosis]
MPGRTSIGVKIRDKVQDKVIAITGGARGIGLATAAALHNLGAKVAIGDIDEAMAKESGADLDLDMYGKLDVTDPDSFSGFLDAVERQLGPIDVLVNNAGIMPVGRIVDEPDPVTRRILDINVYGVILGSKLAAQRMVPRGRGHVINVASLAGEIYAVGVATYCASKHAVVAFTDSARLEYRSAGVKFSMVLPSFVNTELIAGTGGIKGFKNAEPADYRRRDRRADCSSQTAGAGHESGWLDDRGTAVHAAPGFRGLEPTPRRRACLHRRCRHGEAQDLRGSGSRRGVTVAPRRLAWTNARQSYPVRVAHVLSVNLARVRANPDPRAQSKLTGIDKVAASEAVMVRAPGSMHAGVGSGLVGDTVGNPKLHGGDDQAVYAYAREDLDAWETQLHRTLHNGMFGENLTTSGVDVTYARIGERWRIGSDGLVLEVSAPRIPCRTFAAFLDLRYWIKTFTRAAKPGAYLRVIAPGTVRAGDTITVDYRPEHNVTVGLVFRARTSESELLPQLLAADALAAELKAYARERTPSPPPVDSADDV